LVNSSGAQLADKRSLVMRGVQPIMTDVTITNRVSTQHTLVRQVCIHESVRR
jgi:hypothetical protein